MAFGTRKGIAYIGVFILSLLPQLLAAVEPFKALLSEIQPIQIMRFSTASFFLSLVVLFSVFSVYYYASRYHDFGTRTYVFKLYLLLVADAIFIILYFFAGQSEIVVTFIPSLLPVIISSIIGIIGSYFVACITNEECYERPKFQKKKILHSTLNI